MEGGRLCVPIAQHAEGCPRVEVGTGCPAGELWSSLGVGLGPVRSGGQRPVPVLTPAAAPLLSARFLLRGALCTCPWDYCLLPSLCPSVLLASVPAGPSVRVHLRIVGVLRDSHAVLSPGLSVKITVCCLKTSCCKLDSSLNFGRI